MLAPELGQYIDGLTASFAGGDYEKLAGQMLSAPKAFLDRFESGAFETVVRASAVGFTLQASSLEIPPAAPPDVRRDWQRRAEEHAALLRTRASAQLAGGISRDGAGAWLKAAANSASWRGVDGGQRDAADTSGAEYKTWVRAWARKERRPHSNLEGLTIQIDKLFFLPSGRGCYGPRDWDAVPDPAEWVYCGHALMYTYSPTASEYERTLLYSPVERELRKVTRGSFELPPAPPPIVVTPPKIPKPRKPRAPKLPPAPPVAPPAPVAAVKRSANEVALELLDGQLDIQALMIREDAITAEIGQLIARSQQVNFMGPEFDLLSEQRRALQAERNAVMGQREQKVAGLREIVLYKTPAKFAVEKGKARYTKLSEAETALGRLLGPDFFKGKNFTLKVEKCKGGREFHRVGTVFLRTDSTVGTAIHEAGHAIEFYFPDLLARSVAHRNSRTQGEALKTMRAITGNRAYGLDEVTRPDKFFSPYIGKEYKNPAGADRASEVLSMGLEAMYVNPLKLYIDDPDLFAYVWDVMQSGVTP